MPVSCGNYIAIFCSAGSWHIFIIFERILHSCFLIVTAGNISGEVPSSSDSHKIAAV